MKHSGVHADSPQKQLADLGLPGQNTAALRLPNMFIAGAQKCGTSTLHAWLAAHPQCAMSQPKEPMFFNRSSCESDLRAYSKIFPTSETAIIGEASTTYLSMTDVPARIASTLGHDIKFIFLLRNPVQRAVSSYWHMAKRFHDSRRIEDVLITGKETLAAACNTENENILRAESAKKIVTEEYEASLGDRYWSYRYLRNSDYVADLQRFESTFGRKNLLVLLTEELSTNPQHVVQQIAKFLGIKDAFSPAIFGTRHNVTRVPPQNRVSKLVANIIAKSPRLTAAPLRRMVSSFSKPPPQATKAVTECLALLYRQHNEQLANYLKRDLRDWN